MKRLFAALTLAVIAAAALTAASGARDRPFGSATLIAMKWGPAPEEKDLGTAGGNTDPGGQFSKSQIERFRCTSSGAPAVWVDISCNTPQYGQDFAPDNEIAVAVNPKNPNHIVAGSNDYYYRFNNSTGARHAIVPTGFFTSVDGGATWVDGQIPLRSGNGAGDPAPAFVGRDSTANPAQSTVLMAQLENTGGQGGCCVSQGDVSVSRSTDGGFTWSEPVTVLHGTGAGIGPANRAVFYDKEWLTVNNVPGTPAYGRAVVTATKFVNTLHGAYAESGIVMSYSDDGGRTWSRPIPIHGRNPAFCTYQETGPDDGSCDENQFSIPEYGADGTLYVHFFNGQHEEAWEVDFDFDSQIMVVEAPPTSGPPAFETEAEHVVDLEDGLSDMPWSVIGRLTIYGHQIRWNAAGNITADPTNPNHLTIVYADRGTPNPNATERCFFSAPGAPPAYDPCNAGPGSDTDVYRAESFDGGETWPVSRAIVEEHPSGGSGWFPWADYKSDGTLAVAWDQDLAPAPADVFRHVLKVGAAPSAAVGPDEHVDISVTHWAGQYVPEPAWPRVCGPAGYTDPPVVDATGKDCNVFHGDYTGLAVGPDNSVHVVWTGLNRRAVSPQRDPYTGGPHDGMAQDAMYARR